MLAAISLIVLMNLRRRPYLAVGWFWYLGTLVPVIGLVQVGSQALADRYTYVPLIGAFIMVVWGGGELFAGWFCRRKISVLLVLGLMGALMLVTRQQVRYWRDSITLFEHTLAVTEKNCTIHSNLGTALVSNGRIDDAVRHYQQAIEACPGYAEAYNNLGVAHSRRGENRRAEAYFRRAISLRPEYVQAHINLGFARVAQGQWQDGLNYYNQALSLDPENFRAYNSIGLVHVRRGDFTAAIQFFSEALRIWPQFASARNNLRQTLEWQEKIDAELAGLAAAIKSAAGKEFRREASGQLTDRKSQLDSVIAQYRGILAKLPGFNPADFDLNRYPYYRDVLKDYTRRVSALENKPPGGAN